MLDLNEAGGDEIGRLFSMWRAEFRRVAISEPAIAAKVRRLADLEAQILLQPARSARDVWIMVAAVDAHGDLGCSPGGTRLAALAWQSIR